MPPKTQAPSFTATTFAQPSFRCPLLQDPAAILPSLQCTVTFPSYTCPHMGDTDGQSSTPTPSGLGALDCVAPGVQRTRCGSGIHTIPDKHTNARVSLTAVSRKTKTLLEGGGVKVAPGVCNGPGRTRRKAQL